MAGLALRWAELLHFSTAAGTAIPNPGLTWMGSDLKKNTRKTEIYENCIYSRLERRVLSSLKVKSCKLRGGTVRGYTERQFPKGSPEDASLRRGLVTGSVVK